MSLCTIASIAYNCSYHLQSRLFIFLSSILFTWFLSSELYPIGLHYITSYWSLSSAEVQKAPRIFHLNPSISHHTAVASQCRPCELPGELWGSTPLPKVCCCSLRTFCGSLRLLRWSCGRLTLVFTLPFAVAKEDDPTRLFFAKKPAS